MEKDYSKMSDSELAEEARRLNNEASNLYGEAKKINELLQARSSNIVKDYIDKYLVVTSISGENYIYTRYLHVTSYHPHSWEPDGTFEFDYCLTLTTKKTSGEVTAVSSDTYLRLEEITNQYNKVEIKSEEEFKEIMKDLYTKLEKFIVR